MAHDVFVSYAALNKAAADACVAALEREAIRCWVAPRDVIPGRNYMASVSEAVREADVMVLVFSEAANDSNHVGREVQQAAERGMPILPLRIEEAQPGDSLSYALVGTHWLDAMSAPLDDHLRRLTAATQALLGYSRGSGATPAPDVPPAHGPHSLDIGRTPPETIPPPVVARSLPPSDSGAHSAPSAGASAPAEPVGTEFRGPDGHVPSSRRDYPSPRLLAWILWPVLSFGLLGSVPFLWAAIRKPVRKWVVPAVVAPLFPLGFFVALATTTEPASAGNAFMGLVSLFGTVVAVPVAAIVYGLQWRKDWQSDRPAGSSSRPSPPP